MDDTRNPLATRFLAFKELRCCPISGYNHWADENQWIHRLMPLSSQATVQSIHHICYQKLPATTGKCFFFFFFNHFPRCGHYYSCWHHFSDTNITNEILFLCSSCLTLWAWQCFLGLHRNSCQKSGLDYSNIPGWDRAIFHREAYLISTLGNLFTSLFSREQSSNFRPSGGLFNHRVPPSTFSFSLFSLLVVFFFFIICLLLNKSCYLDPPFEYVLPDSWKALLFSTLQLQTSKLLFILHVSPPWRTLS